MLLPGGIHTGLRRSGGLGRRALCVEQAGLPCDQDGTQYDHQPGGHGQRPPPLPPAAAGLRGGLGLLLLMLGEDLGKGPVKIHLLVGFLTKGGQ